jgi:hypothetical protein
VNIIESEKGEGGDDEKQTDRERKKEIYTERNKKTGIRDYNKETDKKGADCERDRDRYKYSRGRDRQGWTDKHQTETDM